MRRIDIVENYGRCSLYFDALGLPCVLANLKVRIGHRRRGTGRRLLRSAVELAASTGIKNIYLRVKGTLWLKNFYGREGFVYYACDSYDKNQVWMMKDLTTEPAAAGRLRT